MSIPNLKRIKVSSQQELRNWLVKHPDADQSVMVVTCNKKSPDKYVSPEQLSEVLAENGWNEGRKYTLKSNLVGHVISQA